MIVYMPFIMVQFLSMVLNCGPFCDVIVESVQVTKYIQPVGYQHNEVIKFVSSLIEVYNPVYLNRTRCYPYKFTFLFFFSLSKFRTSASLMRRSCVTS